MKIRTTAKIGTDFPDDQVEEVGEIIQPGGRGIAVAIAELLKHVGATVSEPFTGEHGWEIDIHFKGRNPWCGIQDAGGYIYFIMEDRGAWFDDRPEYIDLVVGLNAALHKDVRFHDIRWYDRGDINLDCAPSSSPVD